MAHGRNGFGCVDGFGCSDLAKLGSVATDLALMGLATMVLAATGDGFGSNGLARHVLGHDGLLHVGL